MSSEVFVTNGSQAAPTFPYPPTPLDRIDARIAERLLGGRWRRAVTTPICTSSTGRAATFRFEEGRVRTVGRAIVLGLGVRVVRGDASGYAYTEELSEARMLEAARTAGQIAAQWRGAAPGRAGHASPAQLLSRCSSCRWPARGGEGRPAPAGGCGGAGLRFAHRTRRGWLRRGLVGRADRDAPTARWRAIASRWFASASASVAEEKGKRQSGRSGTAKRRGLDLFAEPGATPEEHGREAARLAIAMLHAEEAPAGPMEVVLAAGESGILLHEAVGHGLEADFNRKKTSNYSGQIGKPVASPLCTVVDDATIASARGSINVDDEGIPGGRNVLIENGILVGYMQDRISARHFGVKPTGNGRRESFRHPPLPRMTNTMLLAGQRRSRGHHSLR